MKNVILRVPALPVLKGFRSARLSVCANGMAVTWFLGHDLEPSAAAIAYHSEGRRDDPQVLAMRALVKR